MKIFKYVTLIAFMTLNNPLLAMNALQRKQAAVAAEQEKKAVATLKKLRKKLHAPKGKPELAPGVKTFGSNQNPISLDLEKNDKGEWYPTTTALTQLLKTYIPDMPKITVEKSNAKGVRHGALFVAYRNAYKTAEGDTVEKRPLFFLKISANTEENIPKKLDELQKGPVGEFNLKALSDRELPIVVLQEMFFIYKGKDNKPYTLEVMHIAHGQSVASIGSKKIPVDSTNETLIQHCAEKVGKSLGLFHVYFMNYHNSSDPVQWTTMIHGDFHYGNVFFDEKSSRVYFIDNGDMHEDHPFGKSGRPLKDFPDVGRLLTVTSPNCETEPDPLKYPQIIFFFSYIKAYLSAYPLDKRKFLVSYLQANLLCYSRLKEYTATWPKDPETKFIETFVTELDKIFQEACRQ